MSLSSFTRSSSSFSTRSPFSRPPRFRSRRVTIRLGVSGVTGVNGMYGLYGVGMPVLGPFSCLVGRSRIVVLVAGALCKGNASRNGSDPPCDGPLDDEDARWLLDDRLNGAGAGARPIPEDFAGGGGAGETRIGGAGGAVGL